MPDSLKLTRSFAPLLVSLLLLLVPVAYVASYAGLVRPGRVFYTCSHLGNGEILVEPYAFGDEWSERIFWPLEQLDRRLRPDVWPGEFDQQRPPGRPFALELSEAR